MSQDKNNNYRCDKEHLNQIKQLAQFLGINKTEVMRVVVDFAYQSSNAVDEFMREDEEA